MMESYRPLAVPADMLAKVMPADQQASFTNAGYVMVVLSVAFAIWLSVRRKSFVPIAFIIGGALATFIEPIIDVNGLAFFPREGQWTAIEAIGRHIPIFLLTSFTWFAGGQALYIHHRLSRRATMRELWLTYAAFIVINMILEVPALHIGVAYYYGPQPLVLFRMPMWYTFVNPLMPIMAGALAYALRRELTGIKGLLVAPIVPMCGGIAYGAAAWPTFLALNSDVSDGVRVVAALLTMAYGCAIVWFVGHSLKLQPKR